MRYRIIQATTGADLGVYDGESPEDAIGAMLADGGAPTAEPDPGLVAVEACDAAPADIMGAHG